MGDALPPDPYLALGVAKDATAAAIKAQYRKLVLKCHPDKIQDETEKQNASDKFHKIQTAWEIVGDEARRARYDAQCKLAELRKDVFGGGMMKGGPDVRTAAYKMPTDSARGGDFYARGPDRYGARLSPQYEERRPSYTQADYFDEPPRPTARKFDDYERSSKRTSPREERERPRPSAKETKETERSSRKEKSRRTEKDVRKERERKFAYAQVEIDTESDSDQYERARRRMREEDDLRRAREQYQTTVERQREEAESGIYPDERVKKMFSQNSDAKDYIERSRLNQPRGESEPRLRRPSPERKSSSREKIEYIERSKGKPPVTIRRGSGKVQSSRRDTTKSSKGEKDRRPSYEEVDEPQEAKRPPPLAHAKSSPADIRPPFPRQRSYTVQEEQHKEDPPKPAFRRSETMPQSPTAAHPRESRRKESSKLRPPAPEEAYLTPEASPPPETTEARKYRYGAEYADDVEYPTPDGYRTEVREPTRQRMTRSPSPMRERERERERPRAATSTKPTSASSQPPPMPPRTTSTSYMYPDPSRPPVPSRENSGRSNLFGEISGGAAAGPGSPRYTYSPPPEAVQTQREFRREDVKFQTGYSSRPASSSTRPKASASERPSYGRKESGRHAVYVR